MTPYDLYKAFLSDLVYTPPEEEVEVKLARVSTVIRKLEKIYDQGPGTDAAEEAIKVLCELRRYEAMIRML
jgi:hypothetical protein